MHKKLMIHQRLLQRFVLVALLPTILIAISSFLISYRGEHNQVLERLEIVNENKNTEITAWIQSIEHELTVPLNQELAQGRPTVILNLAEEGKYYNFYLEAAQKHFERSISQSDEIEEIQLLNLEGNVILSTNNSRIGSTFPEKNFFERSLESDLAVVFPFEGYETNDLNIEKKKIYTAVFSIPVKDSEGEKLGLLIGLVNANKLITILEDATAIGVTGKTIVTNNNICFISKYNESILNKNCPTSNLYPTPEAENRKITSIYQDSNDRTVIAVSSILPEMNSLLIIEQEQAEAFISIINNLKLNILIIIGALIFALLISTITSQSLSRPLGNLVNAARLFSNGQLDKPVEVTTNDEIGILSNTFNEMTDQLSELINSLEQKVEERTQALLNHATQLKTLATISRELTSILDSDQLTEQVAAALNESFPSYERINFYSFDEKTSSFILRTKNKLTQKFCPPQKITSASAEKLIKGFETSNNRQLKIIQNKTNKDNPYSQLIIPLFDGEKIIAFIDVQSKYPHAFSTEEKLILQSLGDQISIALQNAKHYQDARQLAKMEERQRIARDMHDSVQQSIYSVSLLAESGLRLIQSDDYQGAQEHFRDLINAGQDALKEMRMMMFELRPPILKEVGLIGALQQRLDAVEGRAGITTRLFVPEKTDIPMELVEELYPVAMEALNNALRHSNGTEIKIRISDEKNFISMEVNDNGQGINDVNQSMKKGMGIRNMYERIHKIGGTITINTIQNVGTQVLIKVKSV